MEKNDFKPSIIEKYWQKTPGLFSEKYQTDFLKLLLPVNAFLFSRRKKVLKLAGNVKGKKILDVGCGSGVFIIDFVKNGANVAGVDYSQKMLGLARKEIARYRLPKSKYELIKADATKLPFLNRRFDLVLATGLTDYLTDAQNEKFLEEAARVLKRNGSLIVSFPVDKSPFSFVRSGVGLKIRQKFFKLPPIQNQFSLRKIRKFFDKAGLKDVKRTKIFMTMWIVVAKLK